MLINNEANSKIVFILFNINSINNYLYVFNKLMYFLILNYYL